MSHRSLEATTAAQLAAIQAQLARIEDVVHDIQLTVNHVAAFIATQQRATVHAALDAVHDAHDHATRTGRLTDTDWQRLNDYERVLEAQVRAVADELARRLGAGSDLDGHPDHDAKTMAGINPARVAGLVQLHRALVGGLRRWHELLLLHKIQTDEFDEDDARSADRRLRGLRTQHRDLLADVTRLADQADQTRPRSN